jgi:hypothetical protein
LFEFVVTVECDLSRLDAQALRHMGADREPVRRLMSALSERASQLGAMDPGEDRDQRFLEETESILKAWKDDRKNMSNFWKGFFGHGLTDTGGKFLENIISKAAEAAPAGSAGALAGLALSGPLLAAGAGLAVGMFTHAAKTYSDVAERDHDSPYRYLTTMAQAGVIFRSDLRQPLEASKKS